MGIDVTTTGFYSKKTILRTPNSHMLGRWHTSGGREVNSDRSFWRPKEVEQGKQVTDHGRQQTTRAGRREPSSKATIHTFASHNPCHQTTWKPHPWPIPSQMTPHNRTLLVSWWSRSQRSSWPRYQSIGVIARYSSRVQSSHSLLRTSP